MDIQLHYTCVGEGPVLILLHGNGEDSSFFESQIEEFSQDFCVCAIDTRGHGLSPRGEAPFTLFQFADDLLNWMNEQEIEEADILGFSDGANIAMIFALQHPERVRRLILNSGNINPRGLKRFLSRGIMQDYRNACRSDGPDAWRQRELLELMIREPHIAPGELARLTMPTLVIAGDLDIIKPDHTRLIARSIPNSRFAIIPGGHDIANRQPAAFNAVVRTFFESTESSEEEYE